MSGTLNRFKQTDILNRSPSSNKSWWNHALQVSLTRLGNQACINTDKHTYISIDKHDVTTNVDIFSKQKCPLWLFHIVTDTKLLRLLIVSIQLWKRMIQNKQNDLQWSTSSQLIIYPLKKGSVKTSHMATNLPTYHHLETINGTYVTTCQFLAWCFSNDFHSRKLAETKISAASRQKEWSIFVEGGI